ncbi:MAG: Asp-tRNA(Asn)/Glu-tRNA(Gln) amidotransferase subunit GatC [Candidatus Paceibacterota bacterium]
MISKEDIKQLAALARMELPDDEAVKLGGDLENILAYVSELEKVAVPDDLDLSTAPRTNVWREDGAPHPAGRYSADLLKAAPATENNFIKVKKILTNGS